MRNTFETLNPPLLVGVPGSDSVSLSRWGNGDTVTCLSGPDSVNRVLRGAGVPSRQHTISSSRKETDLYLFLHVVGVTTTVGRTLVLLSVEVLLGNLFSRFLVFLGPRNY